MDESRRGSNNRQRYNATPVACTRSWDYRFLHIRTRTAFAIISATGEAALSMGQAGVII